MIRKLRVRLSWTATVGLTLIWLVLWGDAAIATVLVGVLVALGVQLAFPLPDVPEMERFRPIAIARLVLWLVWGLVRASVEVAIGVLAFGRPLRHAIITAPLESGSPFVHAMTVEVVTLIPGSIVVELGPSELVLHVFDARNEAALDRARREVREAETLIMRAFASRDELRAFDEVGR